MPYFTVNNKLHFLEAGENPAQWLPVGAVPITDAQAAILQQPTAAQLWQAEQSAAQAALDKTDAVALRCWKAGVAFPASWVSYTAALRAIVGTASGTPSALPAMPYYPAGT